MVEEEDSRVGRRFEETVDRLADAVTALERRIAETYVRQDVYEAHRRADAQAGAELSRQVQSVRSVLDWTAKIIVGAVLLALLGLVITNGGNTL